MKPFFILLSPDDFLYKREAGLMMPDPLVNLNMRSIMIYAINQPEKTFSTQNAFFCNRMFDMIILVKQQFAS